MFNSVAISLVIFLLSSIEKQGEVSLPINKGMMGGEGERGGIKRIDMRPHPIIFLLWDESIRLDQLPIALILIRLLTLLSLSLHKRNIFIVINFIIQISQFLSLPPPFLSPLFIASHFSFEIIKLLPANESQPVHKGGKLIFGHRLGFIVQNIDYLMQYIQNLAGQIEELAYTALYDLNNERKLTAERKFTEFLFQLPLMQYDQLLETSSEQVIFAVAAILLKNVLNLKQHTSKVMETVNAVLMRWYQPNGILKRSSGEEMKLYIENTLGQFMGNCLKVLFEKDDKREVVGSFLDNLTDKPHYRLFLYYRFIESVSTMDGDTRYVSYRTLLSNFQDNFIPRIFEALFPYFMYISDSMEITQLSFLQSSLSVNELRKDNNRCLLQFSAKNRFTELVFQLLQHVIAFKYNINHKEYNDFQDFERIMISFPDELLLIIIKKHFLNALFNVLMQLMKTQEFRYQEIGLSCLKKILLAKTTYISKEMQTQFYFNNMEGVLNLLQLLIQSNSVCHRSNAIHILQCNINFMMTFGLSDIETKINLNEKYVTFYREWLNLTRQVPLYLLQNDKDPLNSQNELFLAATEMLVSLANQLKINSVTYQKEIYIENYKQYSRKFLNNFVINGSNILGAKAFSFDELNKASEQVLSRVKVVLTYNYLDIFSILEQCCDHLYTGVAGQCSIGNLILLIREMFRESSFLDESIAGKGILLTRGREIDDLGVELRHFGKILARTLNFIIIYQSQSSFQLTYLNNAIILFLSTFIDKCSHNISTGEVEDEPLPPFINYEIYRQMKVFLRADLGDEEFLLNCLSALAKFIQCPGLLNIEYLFEVLNENIIRIKWSMKRQYFKTTQIYQAMIKLFTQLSTEAMPLHIMKLRVLLYKIITTLNFDDALDDYRQSIRATIRLLKNSVQQNEWVKILYDLTGIFESIEGQIIFRYFLRYFVRQVNFSFLLNQLFVSTAFEKPSIYLKDVIHLSWIFISNKSNRLGSGEEGAQIIYQMISLIIPYWNHFLENQSNFNNEQALIEVYKAVSALMNDGHINICLLDKFMAANFRKLIFLLIRTMSNAIQSVESSAELGKQLFTLAQILAGRVVRPLFNNSDPEIGKSIHFLVNKLMNKLTSSFESIVNGAFQQSLLHPIVTIVEKYFEFIRTNKQKKHLRALIGSIAHAINDNQHKQLCLEALIKIAMEFRQNFELNLLTIARICVNLISFYNIDPNVIIRKLGLNDSKDIQEIERIFKHIRQAIEDHEWLTFQMKDWLKIQSRFLGAVDNDY